MTDKTKQNFEPELKCTGNFNLTFDDIHQIKFGAASYGLDREKYIKEIVKRYNDFAVIQKRLNEVESKLESIKKGIRIQLSHIEGDLCGIEDTKGNADVMGISEVTTILNRMFKNFNDLIQQP